MKWAVAAMLALLAISGCEPLEKGPGLSQLDTIDKADKDEEAWFKSFYGSKHCGVTAGYCKPGEDNGSDSGTGGWWGSSGMPDGGSYGHDSGSGW